MFTPQQLEQISFAKVRFGGYDMDSVDELLEPLLDDYVTLYKENTTLKSKMRVLVEKLEEYRKNESTVKDALRSAQKTCDAMVREAEVKCLNMMRQAESSADSHANTAVLAPTQLADAKKATLEGISSLEGQLNDILAKLAALKEEAQKEVPLVAQPIPTTVPNERTEEEVAKEIAQNLEKLVGTTEDTAPVAPRPVRADGSTNRFTSMNIQFGKNYDPNKR